MPQTDKYKINVNQKLFMAMSYDTPRYWFDTIYALILIEHKEQTFDSDNIKKDLLSLVFPLKNLL